MFDTGNGTITQDEVYNCYTGIGGLHGLQQDDYTNYHDYSEAKKGLEMGQFFPPHTVCHDIGGAVGVGIHRYTTRYVLRDG